MVDTGMGLARAATFWKQSGLDVVRECQALPLDRVANLTLVIDAHTFEVTLTRTARELDAAVGHQEPVPRAQSAFELEPWFRKRGESSGRSQTAPASSRSTAGDEAVHPRMPPPVEYSARS
jgi:hypothetical protein